MDPLLAAFAVSLLATTWLVILGTVRVLATRSGTDEDPGMKRVAWMTLALGGVAAVLTVVLWLVAVRAVG